MSRNSKHVGRRTGRREFLKKALVGSGAAVVAVTSGTAVAAPKFKQVAAVEPKLQAQGYRVTPHVRDYYKTADL